MRVEVPPHPVPVGPLAVRWISHDLPPFRAGVASAATVELENAGTATWITRAGLGIHLGYHWLDLRGNAIVWAPEFVPMHHPVPPGERVEVGLQVRAPMPPGRYRLAFDLVDEGRYWLEELGNERLEVDVGVASRLSERTLSVSVRDGHPELLALTESALAALEEPVTEHGAATAFLAAGCRPATDWSRRVLDAHEEGFAAVAGSIDLQGSILSRRRGRLLAPWRPGFGRSPAWTRPLLCPSLTSELADQVPWTETVAGLPAVEPLQVLEPWVCDGRIRVALDARALPRDDRPPA